MIIKQKVSNKIIDKLNIAPVGQKIKFGVGTITIKKFCAGNDHCLLCVFFNKELCKTVDCVRENGDSGVYFEYKENGNSK